MCARRLRVWDYLLSAGEPPDREIVHSHDFNRYLTPFRAEWDPKDPSERVVVVGRWGMLSLMLLQWPHAGTWQPCSRRIFASHPL